MSPLRLLLALAGVFAAFPVFATQPARYNLVAIVTDDQAPWTLGCYGNAEAKTPNTDRLAKEGARFTNAFTVTPVCSPSRAAYLTGRHGIELGITDFIDSTEHAAGVGLPENTPTWPKLLQKAGYTTALVGKWHLGGRPHQHPNACGFDHFFGEPKGSFVPVDPVFDLNGKPTPTKGFSSNVVTDEAIRWVGANKDKPFALCLHFREPHTPYAPVPPEDAAVYKDFTPTVPEFPGLVKSHVENQTRLYYAAVRAIDRNLGRLLDELDRLKLADRTIVMFTSDHGYNIGHHGIQHKGNGHWIAGGVNGPKRPNMWDTSLKIPLIVRWPGVTKPGTVVPEMVANIDTFRTVCGMLDVPAPKDMDIHGLDFTAFLRGVAMTAWRANVFGAYDLHNGGLAYMRMVRTDKWKLVRHYKANGLDELYDLTADPGELKNLYATAAAKGIREELQKQLDYWMKAVKDPLLK